MKKNRVRRIIDLEVIGDHPDYVMEVLNRELNQRLQDLHWPGVVIRIIDPIGGLKCSVCDGTGRSPKLFEYKECKYCKGLGYMSIPSPVSKTSLA